MLLDESLLNAIRADSEWRAKEVAKGGVHRWNEENLGTAWGIANATSGLATVAVGAGQQMVKGLAQQGQTAQVNAGVNQGNGRPITGSDWHKHFCQRYGSNNVTWKPNSLNSIHQNPAQLHGATKQEVGGLLGNGWTSGTYGSNGTGWKFTSGDNMVFHHPGGGVHAGAYSGFSSAVHGKVKVVGPDYVPIPGDKSTIINIGG